MTIQLKPGARLRSAVCDTALVVVRARDAAVDLRCGGAPVLPHGDACLRLEPTAPFNAGTLGKRYADPRAGLEILCTKGGTGTLTVGARPLPLQGAKPLPASD